MKVLFLYLAKFWVKNNFINLEHLELRKSFFYHSKLQKCRNLKFLWIVDCHQSLKYLLNLSENVKTSLKYLTIQAYNGYYNLDVLQILDLFCNLEELELINMYDISIVFLVEIKHLRLRKITLTNCRKFIGACVKSEAAMIISEVSFDIIDIGDFYLILVELYFIYTLIPFFFAHLLFSRDLFSRH